MPSTNSTKMNCGSRVRNGTSVTLNRFPYSGCRGSTTSTNSSVRACCAQPPVSCKSLVRWTRGSRPLVSRSRPAVGPLVRVPQQGRTSAQDSVVGPQRPGDLLQAAGARRIPVPLRQRAGDRDHLGPVTATLVGLAHRRPARQLMRSGGEIIFPARETFSILASILG